MFPTRYSPASVFAEMNRLSRELDRALGVRANGRDGALWPPMNLWSDADNLYLEAELPGFSLDALEITVTGERQLSIKGNRTRPSPENASWHRQERAYGEFTRVVDLPELVDTNRVAAEFKDGVLLVTLPKREEAKPRRIDVQVKQ